MARNCVSGRRDSQGSHVPHFFYLAELTHLTILRGLLATGYFLLICIIVYYSELSYEPPRSREPI